MRLLALFAFVLFLAASVYAKSSSSSHSKPHRIPVHHPHPPRVSQNETVKVDSAVGGQSDRYPYLRSALTNFYRVTKGSYWTNANNWQASSDPCSNWYGITCDSNGVHLSLPNNNVAGDLTTILGSLQTTGYTMFTIDLSNNEITGNVGLTMSNFYNLAAINLSGNQLSGSFPDNIFAISGISTVGLGSNKLSGPVDLAVCNGNLQHLDISSNLFIGGLPSCLGQLSHLNSVNASYNQLNGTVPFFQNFNNNLVLDVSYNKFTEIDAGNAGPTFHFCNFYGNGFACPVPNWAVQQCVARCY